MKKQLILILTAFILILAHLRSVSATEQETLKLQLKWTHQFQFAGYYAAKEQGYYADVGLDVQFLERASDFDPVSQVISDVTDYGIGSAGILLSREKGAPIKALAAIFQHNPLVFISKQSSGINSPYKIKGKRIMLESLDEYAPLRALCVGTGLKDTDFISLEHSHNHDDLINGKTDVISAYSTNAPYYYQEQGVAINIIAPQDYGIDFYGDIIFTSEQELITHPGRAERFLKASIKGWQYALNHIEELVQLIHYKYQSKLSLNTLRNEAQATKKLILSDNTPLGEIKASRLQRVAEVYTQLGMAEQINRKEIDDFIYSSHRIHLSKEEKTWLDQHPVISFTGDPDWLPYEAFDNNGQYIGIVAEHLKIVEQHLGIHFDIIPTKSWQESIAKVLHGEIDVISETIDSQLGSELNFTAAYLSSPIVIVMHEKQPYIDNIDQLQDKKIALVKEYGYIQKIINKYPTIDYHWVDTLEEGLQAVSSGKVDALLATLTHTAYQISKSSIPNVRIVGKTEFSNDLGLGVKKDYAPLIPMLDRALVSITEKEKKQIFDRWGDTKFAPKTNYKIITQTIAGFVLLIVIILYWNRKLHQEITARKQAEQALTISETRFRSLLEGVSGIAVFGLNIHRKVIFWNKASEERYGFSEHDAMDKYIEDLIIPPAKKNAYLKLIHDWLLRGKSIPADEFEFQDKNGAPINVFSSHIMQTNIHGQQEIFNIDIDLRERNQAQQQLKKLSLAIEHSPNAVMMTDAESNIEYINPKFTELTYYTPQEVLGNRPAMFSSGKTSPATYKELWKTIKAGKEWQGELYNRKKNGQYYWARETIAPITNKTGEITHFISIQEDITESKRIHDDISHRANHDMLTGLINRTEFEQRLKHILAISKDNRATHALCFLDLDKFKLVNDSCGHIAGDELLRQLGKLLSSHIRHQDTLARLGGDEFAILIEYCSLKEAANAAEKLRQLIEDFQFSWEDRSFRIGVSIGLALISDETKDTSEALKQADLACYAAKDSGRNRIHIYHPADEQVAQQEGDIHWAPRITKALENDYFLLYVQAIKPLSNKKLKTSYEILIRLQEPGGDITPPGAFFPAIERYNLAYKMDSWVIKQTFLWIVRHKHQLDNIHHFSINLSGQSLGQKNLLSYITQLLDETGIPAQKILFEITETSAIQNLRDASTFIHELKKYGCHFALDDFGSGLSSFAYLKNLPVDYLKIDGMFVKDILIDPIDHAMVRSISDIGHVMNIQTIAEFVETIEIQHQLEHIGVDFAQGHGIGQPFPISDLVL